MSKIRIAASSEMREHEMVPVECNGKKLLLTRTAQGLSVLDRRCTHLGADLCKGRIEKGAVVCLANFPRGDDRHLEVRPRGIGQSAEHDKTAGFRLTVFPGAGKIRALRHTVLPREAHGPGAARRKNQTPCWVV